MLIQEESLAESQYPTFNWQNIWDNYLNVFIHSYNKEIIYKHLHMCLATNKKLYTMNLIDSSICSKCMADREETPIHMFYQCEYTCFTNVNMPMQYLCGYLGYYCISAILSQYQT